MSKKKYYNTIISQILRSKLSGLGWFQKYSRPTLPDRDQETLIPYTQ